MLEMASEKECHDSDTPWAKHFVEKVSEFEGYVQDCETLELVQREYEDNFGVTFNVRDTSKLKDLDDVIRMPNRYYFAEPQPKKVKGLSLPFDGFPFIVTRRITKECEYGPDHKRSKKEITQTLDEHTYSTNCERKRVQSTKKKNCQAQMKIREILKLRAVQVSRNTQYAKRLGKRMLKEEVNSPTFDTSKLEKQIWIKLPHMQDHVEHLVGQPALHFQRVDPRVRRKVSELLEAGVVKVAEMRRHLKIFVEQDLFAGQTAPPKSRRAYYPSDRDLYNYMQYTSKKSRHSPNDQLNLQHYIDNKKEQTDDELFYRSHSNEPLLSGEEVPEAVNVQNLLFVYQSKWQKRILNLYGNDICLMDSTYRTSKYDIPCFAVSVPTNIGYLPVCFFIVEYERTKNIQEALEILKSWNECWNPLNFMTDFDEREIHAIEQTFPSTEVLLCDFHRLQSWDRWLRTEQNGCRDKKKDILTMLKKISGALTEKAYTEAVEELRGSDVWQQNERLQQWLCRKWLPNSRRWVKAFRNSRLNNRVNTNNGIERQHRQLKEQFLGLSDNTLTGLVKLLIEEFVPDCLRRYERNNIRASNLRKTYTGDLPSFLRNRPQHFIKFCVKRMNHCIDTQDIHQTGDKEFLVKSESRNHSHKVCFSTSLPSCTCEDWEDNHLPCKHMLAVFMLTEYDWNSLSSEYKACPVFNLDPGVIGYEDTVADEKPTKREKNASVPRHRDPTSPGTKYSAKDCREFCSELTRLTYILDKGEVSSLAQKLEDIYTSFRQNVTKEAGLECRPSKPLRQKRIKRQSLASLRKNEETKSTDQENKKQDHPEFVSDVSEIQGNSQQQQALEKDTGEEQHVVQSSEDCVEKGCYPLISPLCSLGPVERNKVLDVWQIQGKSLHKQVGIKGLTILDLKTLDPHPSARELLRLNAENQKLGLEIPWMSGWLNDKIVNTFIQSIVDSSDRIMLIDSLAFQQISNSQRIHSPRTTGNYDNHSQKSVVVIDDNDIFTIQEATHVPEKEPKIFSKVTFSAMKKILVPVCSDHHWTLTVLDTEKKVIRQYDPMTGVGNKEIVNILKLFLKNRLPVKNFTEEKRSYPLQEDGSSCGVFTCFYAMNECTEYHQVEQRLGSDELRIQIASLLLLDGPAMQNTLTSCCEPESATMSSHADTSTSSSGDEDLVPAFSSSLNRISDTTNVNNSVWIPWDKSIDAALTAIKQCGYETVTYLMARVDKEKIWFEDIKDLVTGKTLRDNVLDAYLELIVKGQKSKKILHIDAYSLTEILDNGSKASIYMIKDNIDDYDLLMGVYNENRVHWSLVVIAPAVNTVTYVNPMGETTECKERVKEGWRSYMRKRLIAGVSCGQKQRKWEILQLDHPKQEDGVSCGVFALHFAECIAKDVPMDFGSGKLSVDRKRWAIAKKLLDNSDPVNDFCRHCGVHYKNSQIEDWVRCDFCETNGWFHHCHSKFRNQPLEHIRQIKFQCVWCQLRRRKAFDTSFDKPLSTIPVPLLTSTPIKYSDELPDLVWPSENRATVHAETPTTTAAPKESKSATETRHPIVLVEKPKQVRRCFGCNSLFCWTSNLPPRNLVIRNKGPRCFMKSGEWLTTHANRYFHARYHCIKTHFPRFSIEDLVIGPDVTLTQEQRLYLHSQGIPITKILT